MYWYAKESIENVATNAWCVDISPFKNGYEDTVLVAVPITTVIVSLNNNTALLETRTYTQLL